jgi:hypothetical protein
MSSLTNIYYFVSLATTRTHIVFTNENINDFIEQNIRNKLDDVLYHILNQKYIYHFVKRNVLIENVEPLINTLKTNKIRLDQFITKTRNEIAYEKRLILGANNELELKPIVERIFGVDLIKTLDKYDIYDFYDVNHKYVFEIKSLNITYNVFIGANKIANVGNFKLIFIFKCNVSRFIYYLIYSKDLFDSLELRNIEMRGKLTPSPMYIIPVKHLTVLHQTDRIILD